MEDFCHQVVDFGVWNAPIPQSRYRVLFWAPRQNTVAFESVAEIEQQNCQRALQGDLGQQLRQCRRPPARSRQT
jgi:hypothetical protein